MKKLLVLTAAAGLLAVLPAFQEMPDVMTVGSHVRPARITQEPAPVPEPCGPVWLALQAMTRDEKTNARISIESAEPLAREIESLWNQGRFESALELFPELGDVEIGVTWRVPLRAPETDWEIDVQIGPRDTIKEFHFDRDRNTGNLFCAYRYLGDGRTSNWGISMSTNGGTDWTETFAWWAGYLFPSVGAVCIGNYCYIGYVGYSDFSEARLRRVFASNGAEAAFPGGATNLTLHDTGTDPIVDVCLWSNADTTFGPRVYYSYITASHQLGVMWMDTVTFDTHHFRGEPQDAKTGLDMQYNVMRSTHYLIISYIDTLDRIRVLGVTAGGGDTLEYLYQGGYTTIGDYTSLAAWGDTFLVCFDYQASNRQARYLTSYNNGTDWYWLYFGDTTASFTRSADVTGRFGYGTGVVFWQYPQTPDGVSYTWRPYRTNWLPRVRVQARNTLSATPAQVEWVEPDVPGIVYRASRERIFYSRSDWTGIADRPGPTLPDRYNLTAIPTATGTRVRFALPASGPVRLSLYDAIGRRVAGLDRTLPAGNHNLMLPTGPAGVYFVQLVAPDGTATTRTFALR